MIVTLFHKAVDIACNPNLSMPPRVRWGLYTRKLADEISRIRVRKSGQFSYFRKPEDYVMSRANYVALGGVLALGAFVLFLQCRKQKEADSALEEKSNHWGPAK
jgi:hypothetical protein